MSFISRIIDIVLHLDKHLGALIEHNGPWTYVILFIVIFCETGLVVTPFLPGDSLLFAAGAFAAKPVLTGGMDLRPGWLFLILAAAAVAGDTINYWIGRVVGPKVFHREKVRFFKKEYLDRTHRFFEKYGGETIIIARFVPIVRTFAPFVAGIGRMSYARFISYNVVGGVAWVALFVWGGYFFGNLPFIQRHFSLVIVVIILISLVPAGLEFIRQHRSKAAPPARD
jgi:membrane-associated protein